MTTQTLADLYSKGYKLKKFSGLNRAAGKGDPIGVALFEKRSDFFESVVYERFDGWLYATPESLCVTSGFMVRWRGRYERARSTAGKGN